MAYDDRDYFREKPKFEISWSVGHATKLLVIVSSVAYIVAMFMGDNTSFMDPEFWQQAIALPDSSQHLVLNGVVLIPSNIIPWGASEFHPQHWKLLTSWLVAPGLLSAILTALFVFFVGRSVEQFFGVKRFLILFLLCCVTAAILSSIIDPWILAERREAVIMGASPGILGCYATLLWIAPNQKGIFGWKVKHVVSVLLVAMVIISLISALGSSSTVVLSPTHGIFGVIPAALWMTYLKAKDRLPAPELRGKSKDDERGFSLPSFLEHDNEEKTGRERARRKLKENLDKDAANAQRLDAILAKISEKGMDSLSRKERKFLDEQSKAKTGDFGGGKS